MALGKHQRSIYAFRQPEYTVGLLNTWGIEVSQTTVIGKPIWCDTVGSVDNGRVCRIHLTESTHTGDLKHTKQNSG
jgi:hypothetical protein